MKKLILLIALFFVAISGAQSKYQTNMKKAFTLWEQGKMMEASQLFERISTVETDNWKPAYYAATIEIIGSFGLKDEAEMTAKLTKAEEFLNLAKSNSENNPEILITRALLNTAYISFDGQKYGMTLSGDNNQIYAKALQIAPNNPRVILSNAQWNMGTAKFFEKSTKPYCDEIKRAIELGENEKIEDEFYPLFSVERAKEALKDCEE